jgi:diguanylate cyclase (GGDEF)-like protein
LLLADRLSVSSRFLLVLAIGLVFQAGISVASLLYLKQSLQQDRINEVKHLLETAYSTVVFYHDQASKGLMSDLQARQGAAAAIRAMRYDGTNYYCIWDLNGKGIAHGANPALEGRTFVNSPDAKKNPVVAYMVGKVLEAVKNDQGEGISSYRIPKGGQKTPQDKIAYSKLFAPWGWSITTGAYVDDIDRTFWSRAVSVLMISLVLTAVAAAVTFYLGRDLARAINRLTNRVTRVAKGELEGDIPEIQRSDEVGVMARALLVLRDTSREAAELRLDQLTGLPTRKLLMDRLRIAKALSARESSYGGVMLIDLDKFKSLNDTHGHDIGDALLREVAQRLSTCVRDIDTAARLGGDEFVVVLVNIGRTEAEAATNIETVSANISAVLSQPCHLGRLTYTATASIGITLFQGDQFSAEDLLKQADLAMYKSKESGRNTSRFFDAHMEATVLERATMEKELRQGLSEHQFQLHYQPQVALGGRLIGAEALLRWYHPRRGLVAPREFIALAEETGLILPLGQWVLETACQQLALWDKRSGKSDFKLAVNVSARQFQQADFVQQVRATLQRTGADPNRLTLELTESLLVQNVEDVTRKMADLKANGVSFALDDFGIGYSSMYSLKRLPFDQLKVERAFVRHILTDPNDAAIANMIVALAQTLGLEVVAEGIETAAQRDFLAAAGCHYFQGNFFSRPRPLASFEEYAFGPNPTEVSGAEVA